MVNGNLCGQHFHKPSKAAMSSFIVPARKLAEGWASAQKQTFSAQPCAALAVVVKAVLLTSYVECIILKVCKVFTNQQNDAKDHRQS